MSFLSRAYGVTVRQKRSAPGNRPSLEVLEDRLAPATFMVLHALDFGPGSLRQAIVDANASPGPDTVVFNIAEGGTQTIRPASALPEIIDPVTIDGTTQPGYAGSPLIVLNGDEAGPSAVGLRITAGNSTVRGLVINGFDDGFASYGIALSGKGGNIITGNFIGTDVSGTVAVGNGAGVALQNTSDNLIGGTEPGDGNLISGNVGGIGMSGGTGNRVQGNLIGTDVTGRVRLGNRTGVYVSGGLDHLIGGTEAGARNVISGSTGDYPSSGFGIMITLHSATGSVARNHRVQGNYIGTDITGGQALGNNEEGIRVDFSSMNIIVGGTEPGARNIVSANGASGIYISGGSGNVVQGNYVGTDVTGTHALGNHNGVIIGGSLNIVGGTTPEAGNLLSGNRTYGLGISGSRHLVQGNLIGTDASGTVALPNAFGGVGSNAIESTIGGTEPGAGNVISGNGIYGVRLMNTHNRIQGNFIGTDVTGLHPLGNGAFGISIEGFNTVVGGTTPEARNIISANDTGVSILIGNAFVQGNFIGTDVTGTRALGNRNGVTISSSNNNVGGADAGNTIAFNGGTGVEVRFGSQNRIQGNSIHSNTGLGIDLGGNGVTANDPGDADTGPNNLQNYPALTSSVVTPGTTTIRGTLSSAADRSYVLEFYSSATADPSGYGEGATFLGTAVVATGSDGSATFKVTFSTAVQAGHFLTATATDQAGNTSEFSAALRVKKAPAPGNDTTAMAEEPTDEATLMGNDTGANGDSLTISGWTSPNNGEMCANAGDVSRAAPLWAFTPESRSERHLLTRQQGLTDGTGSLNALNGGYFLEDRAAVLDEHDADVLAVVGGQDWFSSEPVRVHLSTLDDQAFAAALEVILGQ